jgi:hypothetical protein
MTTLPHLSSRISLSLLHVGGTIASFALDWRSNHLLSPEWSPHARFHGGLFLFSMAGCAITSLWLLWRPSREPAVAIVTAALLLLAYWTPLFYVHALVPGSSIWAGPVGQEPHWGSMVVYPNLVFAGAVVVVTLLAARLGLAKPNNAPEPTPMSVTSPAAQAPRKP